MPKRPIASALHALGSSRAEILVTRVPAPRAARVGAERPGRRAVARDETPGLGRYIAIAAAASITVVLIATAAALIATGTPVAASLGIGAFAGLWGGGGFGAMIGGVLYVHRFVEPAYFPSLVGSELDRAPELLPPWPSEGSGPGRR